jgi:hypothetical protein
MAKEVGMEKKSKKILTEEIVYIRLLALCGFRTAGLFLLPERAESILDN